MTDRAGAERDEKGFVPPSRDDVTDVQLLLGAFRSYMQEVQDLGNIVRPALSRIEDSIKQVLANQSALENRVVALEGRVDAHRDRQRVETSEREAIEARLDTFEQRISALEQEQRKDRKP